MPSFGTTNLPNIYLSHSRFTLSGFVNSDAYRRMTNTQSCGALVARLSTLTTDVKRRLPRVLTKICNYIVTDTPCHFLIRQIVTLNHSDMDNFVPFNSYEFLRTNIYFLVFRYNLKLHFLIMFCFVFVVCSNCIKLQVATFL